MYRDVVNRKNVCGTLKKFKVNSCCLNNKIGSMCTQFRRHCKCNFQRKNRNTPKHIGNKIRFYTDSERAFLLDVPFIRVHVVTEMNLKLEKYYFYEPFQRRRECENPRMFNVIGEASNIVWWTLVRTIKWYTNSFSPLRIPVPLIKKNIFCFYNWYIQYFINARTQRWIVVFGTRAAI